LFLAEGLRLREQNGLIYDLDVVGRPDTFTVLAALAAVTDKLGLAGTINSTFNEPYEVARQSEAKSLSIRELIIEVTGRQSFIGTAAQVLSGEMGDQVVAGPGDPGADRADRTVTDLRDLEVAEAEDLGEYEGQPSVRVQLAQQGVQRHRLAEVTGRARRGGVLGAQFRRGPGPGAGGPDVIGGDPAGDREQPRADGRLAAEARQRPEGSRVGLLREVLGHAAVAQRDQHPPEQLMGLPHEERRRRTVASTRPQCQRGERGVVNHGTSSLDLLVTGGLMGCAVVCRAWG
ncbi:MAG: hypothetical protein QOC74_977, partial [Pseudonocardiales bacterium]|nr:hypothetical protein [Pseudonocardiales bacterium]